MVVEMVVEMVGGGEPRQMLSDSDGVGMVWMDSGVRLHSVSLNSSFPPRIPSSFLPAARCLL